MTQFETKSISPKIFEITLYHPTNFFIHINNKSPKCSKYQTFGDPFDEKEEGHICIVSQNIDCLIINVKNNSKQERSINWLI